MVVAFAIKISFVAGATAAMHIQQTGSAELPVRTHLEKGSIMADSKISAGITIDSIVDDKIEAALQPLIKQVNEQGSLLASVKEDVIGLRNDVAAVEGKSRAVLVRALNAAIGTLTEGIDAHEASRTGGSTLTPAPSASSRATLLA